MMDNGTQPKTLNGTTMLMTVNGTQLKMPNGTMIHMPANTNKTTGIQTGLSHKLIKPPPHLPVETSKSLQKYLNKKNLIF